MGGNIQDCHAVQRTFSKAARESLSQSQVLCLRGYVPPRYALLCSAMGWEKPVGNVTLDAKVMVDFRACSWTSQSITLPLVASLHDKFSWPPVTQWSVHNGSMIFCRIRRDTGDHCSNRFILHVKRLGHVVLVTSFLDNHG